MRSPCSSARLLHTEKSRQQQARAADKRACREHRMHNDCPAFSLHACTGTGIAPPRTAARTVETKAPPTSDQPRMARVPRCTPYTCMPCTLWQHGYAGCCAAKSLATVLRLWMESATFAPATHCFLRETQRRSKGLLTGLSDIQLQQVEAQQTVPRPRLPHLARLACFPRVRIGCVDALFPLPTGVDALFPLPAAVPLLISRDHTKIWQKILTSFGASAVAQS